MLVLWLLGLTIFSAALAADPVPLGQKVKTTLQTVGVSAGYGTGEVAPETIVGNIINYVLGFLGVIAIIIIIYAGFKWMTAGGSEDQINKAKALMINGLIGLGIIILAFAITTFVINQIQGVTTATSGS